MSSLFFAGNLAERGVADLSRAAPPAILFTGVQLWSGRRRAQYFAIRSELLAQFQAPDIREWLIRDPGFLKEPVRQDAAVVFIDLSGFTSLSESLDRTGYASC